MVECMHPRVRGHHRFMRFKLLICMRCTIFYTITISHLYNGLDWHFEIYFDWHSPPPHTIQHNGNNGRIRNNDGNYPYASAEKMCSNVWTAFHRNIARSLANDNRTEQRKKICQFKMVILYVCSLKMVVGFFFRTLYIHLPSQCCTEIDTWNVYFLFFFLFIGEKEMKKTAAYQHHIQCHQRNREKNKRKKKIIRTKCIFHRTESLLFSFRNFYF